MKAEEWAESVRASLRRQRRLWIFGPPGTEVIIQADQEGLGGKDIPPDDDSLSPDDVRRD